MAQCEIALFTFRQNLSSAERNTAAYRQLEFNYKHLRERKSTSENAKTRGGVGVGEENRMMRA